MPYRMNPWARLIALALALGLTAYGAESYSQSPRVEPASAPSFANHSEGAGTALASASLPAYAGAGAPQLPISPLLIRTADGAKHSFTVELARTPAERAQGLMFRTSLAADGGMLFDFKELESVAMWMKNTLIPLDMLFIARDGRIVRIVERAVPLSLAPIPSGEPVLAVLELNGGTAARLGLKLGDRVIHPIFQP